MNAHFFDGKVAAYRTALNVVRNMGAEPRLIQELTNLLADTIDGKALEDKALKESASCPSPVPGTIHTFNSSSPSTTG